MFYTNTDFDHLLMYALIKFESHTDSKFYDVIFRLNTIAPKWCSVVNTKASNICISLKLNLVGIVNSMSYEFFDKIS